jgi:hypothetical protein
MLENPGTLEVFLSPDKQLYSDFHTFSSSIELEPTDFRMPVSDQRLITRVNNWYVWLTRVLNKHTLLKQI